jgi:hypothetical protein
MERGFQRTGFATGCSLNAFILQALAMQHPQNGDLAPPRKIVDQEFAHQKPSNARGLEIGHGNAGGRAGGNRLKRGVEFPAEFRCRLGAAM